MSGPVLFMNRATEMAPGFRARRVPNRLGIGTHHSASRFLLFQVRAATIPEMKRALEQIRRTRGGAQSHLMRCADEHRYVVKSQNNPQHSRVLVNPWY